MHRHGLKATDHQAPYSLLFFSSSFFLLSTGTASLSLSLSYTSTSSMEERGDESAGALEADLGEEGAVLIAATASLRHDAEAMTCCLAGSRTA